MTLKPNDQSSSLSAQKRVIGSQEWCAFPVLGIPAILARVDSGARTSCIHAFNIQPFTRKGQDWVSFEVHPLQKNRRVLVRCEAPVADYRQVKSSSGIAEKRYVIQTSLRLWDDDFLIEVTLANRDSMGFRMLLGREAMVGRMMVDPELSHSLGELSEAMLQQYYQDSRRSIDGLRIALLAENEKFLTNRRLLEACEERGHFPSMLNVSACFLSLDSDRCEIYEKDKGVVPAFDVMIPRLPAEQTLFGAGVVRQFMMGGGVAINNPEALLLSRYKLGLLQKMVANDVPISVFGFACSAQDIQLLTKKVGAKSCVVQLVQDYQVRPNIDVSRLSETAILSHAWRHSSSGVMVRGQATQGDYARVSALIVNGRVVGAISQENTAHTQWTGYVSNFKTYQLTKEEKKFVVRVAKLSGLVFLTVDFIRGQNQDSCILVDLVASPIIEIFEKVTGKDIATQIIIEIERICDWQQQCSKI